MSARTLLALLAKTTTPCLAAATLLLTAGCGDTGAGASAGDAAKTGKKTRGGADRAQPVEVTKIQRQDLVETINIVGSLAPNETAQIRAELAGQVREVLFDEGQHVREGQVLVRVDDAELRAQLAQSEARLALATQNLRRTQNLTTQQFISEAEADKTRADYDAAAAEVELLRVRLGKMQIKAPFDGIASARTVSPGDYVNVSMTATPITTIDDLSRLKIEFQVPERFVSRVKPGTRFKVRARTPAGEAETSGVVYFASSIIERATRSTQVKGYLAEVPEGFRPGMFANVELELSTRKNVLVVPEGAILITTTGGTQIVIARARDGGHFADFVAVEAGMRARGLVEITPAAGAKEPVDENASVIASGVGALILYQDARVDPRPLRKEFRLE